MRSKHKGIYFSYNMFKKLLKIDLIATQRFTIYKKNLHVIKKMSYFHLYIYNGKNFYHIYIQPFMVNLRIGELVLTRAPFYTKPKLRKKARRITV